jgi:hypothetical protein
MVFWISESLYFVTVGLIKMSICFFYRRIFTGVAFQRLLWFTQVFNGLVVLTFVLLVFTQCQPLSYVWTAWDGEHQGTCINIQAVSYIHSAINIALDIWLLVLPATQVWSLKMTTKKKAAVFSMFAIGIL